MSDFDLIAIVPSYGRPQNAHRLVKAFEETCTAKTQLVFVLDASDTSASEYPTPHLTSETRGMIPALNAGARALVRDLNPFAVAFLGDDHLPRTVGWDENYLDSLFQLGTGFVYGNDLLQGARIPTQVAMTANIVETLGWMAPPTFKHLYVDDAWKAIGEGLAAIQYLPDTIVEHLHPLAGKAEDDENYARVNAVDIARDDLREFTRWRNQDLPGILEQLRPLQ